MDSYSNRASSLFTTFTTVLFTVAVLNHLTSYVCSPTPTGRITMSDHGILEYSEFKQFKADQIKFDFDMTLDLTSEYNWNVNQIYVFVVASYETSRNSKNEVVIYDRIIKEFNEYKLYMRLIRTKYSLRDEFKGLLGGKKVTLSIRYQVMPIFGVLSIKELPAVGEFMVPHAYSSGVASVDPTTKRAKKN